jgi:hypothetical protein
MMTETIKFGDREVRVHPAADLFPMMTDAELDELAADIAMNGLQHGVAFWTPDDKLYGAGPPEENCLLDGRNRLRAIERAFSDPDERDAALNVALGSGTIKIFGAPIAGPTQLYSRTDPYTYAVSANVHRRHLTGEQKREVIAALLKAQPTKSDRAIAKTAKVDHTGANKRSRILVTNNYEYAIFGSA